MPYIVSHPVPSPSYFYGRDRQVSRLFKLIGGSQAQSATILGVNRAGKTSFLHYIAHPTVMVRYLRHPENVIMVYVDMAACKTPAHFYYRVQAKLKTHLEQISTGFLWKESSPGQMSIHDMEAYLCHFPDRRIVLLLDGFDQMNPESFSSEFLTELRALVSVTDYDLSCVVASAVDLVLLGNRIGLPLSSPFYDLFFPMPIYLGELDTAVIDSLICQPAIQVGDPFSAAELLQIKHLAGTMPFIIQATAARWLYLKQEIFFPDQGIVLNQLVAELSSYFSQWWALLDDCQRQILSQLVQQEPLTDLPFSQFMLQEAEKRLADLGLIVGKGQQVGVNGAIFAAWINQKLGHPIIDYLSPYIDQESDISIPFAP